MYGFCLLNGPRGLHPPTIKIDIFTFPSPGPYLALNVSLFYRDSLGQLQLYSISLPQNTILFVNLRTRKGSLLSIRSNINDAEILRPSVTWPHLAIQPCHTLGIFLPRKASYNFLALTMPNSTVMSVFKFLSFPLFPLTPELWGASSVH